MRKVINNTLRIFVISAVAISTILTFFACWFALGKGRDAAVAMPLIVLQIMAVILAVMIGLTIPVSKRLTNYIMDPLNEVDLENIGDAEVYDELRPFFARVANEKERKEEIEKIRREFTDNV